MTKWIQEIRSTGLEMRKAIEIDLMLRRYQKSINGQIAFEERIQEMGVNAWSVLKNSWRSIIKRSLDVVSTTLSLVIFAPLMGIVALAVKLDSKGPALYSQVRVGKNGKFFKIYKFRTMKNNAEKESGPVWAQQNDPRITRLGKFLRTSHLDELPQLINVLKGEMSLVGPRPERPMFVEELKKVIPHYEQRLSAKPGITGLAQINRTYDETLQDVKQKVRYDRFYIKKMCPFLDVKVLVLTVGTMMFRTGR